MAFLIDETGCPVFSSLNQRTYIHDLAIRAGYRTLLEPIKQAMGTRYVPDATIETLDGERIVRFLQRKIYQR